jgi:hypothetical protein
MKNFKDFLKGLAIGLLNLSEASDFSLCVYYGMSAERFFEALTPADASTPAKLAVTITHTGKMLSPILVSCLHGANDILVNIN